MHASTVMRRAFAIVLAVSAPAVVPASASASCANTAGNLVVNCSFEQPALPDGADVAIAPGGDLGGWTVSQGGDAVDFAEAHFAGAFPVADGRQSVDLNRDNPGGVEQRLATAPGTSYRLTLQESGYPAASANCAGTNPELLRVVVGDVSQVFAFNPNPAASPPGAQAFDTHTIDFVAKGDDLLRLQGANQGCTGPVVDDVSVTQTGAPAPRPGKSMTAVATSGTVLARPPGGRRFVPITKILSLPLRTIVDARHGVVRITATSGGKTYSALFYQGEFQIAQLSKKGATADIELFGGNFAGCPKAPAFSSKARSIRHLWGNGSGPFRTVGRFSSATVRGTKWLTDDQCKGTLTRVVSGRVVVRDFARRRNIVVRAGRSYFAGARGR